MDCYWVFIVDPVITYTLVSLCRVVRLRLTEAQANSLCYKAHKLTGINVKCASGICCVLHKFTYFRALRQLKEVDTDMDRKRIRQEKSADA